MQLSYKNDNDADERLNPSSSSYELNNMEKRAENDIAQKNGDNDSGSSENDLNKKEQSQQGLYQPSALPGGKSSKNMGKLKKYGPGGMLGGLLIGGGALTTLLSPGLLIIHLKETLVGKFNDQNATVQVRSKAMLKKKIGNPTRGLCGKRVTLLCRYKGMSNRMVKRFEKSGIEVEWDGKYDEFNKTEAEAKAKRDRAKSNAAKSPDAEKRRLYSLADAEYNDAIEKAREKTKATKKPRFAKVTNFVFRGEKIAPSKFWATVAGNLPLQNALYRVRHPIYTSFADKIALKMANKFRVIRGKIFDSKLFQGAKDKLNNNKTFAKAREKISQVSGAIKNSNFVKNTRMTEIEGEPDGEGKKTKQEQWHDDADGGEKISKEDADRAAKNEDKMRKNVSEVAKPSAAKKMFAGIKNLLGSPVNNIDKACTAFRLIRVASFAAKWLGALQLLRYFSIFGNIADKTKAGHATPEETELLGNILTSTNSEDKSATDSYGYKYAAYNDLSGTPSLDTNSIKSDNVSEDEKKKIASNDEVLRYRNGQLAGGNFMSAIMAAAGGGGAVKSIDKTCKAQQSVLGQIFTFSVGMLDVISDFVPGVGWTKRAGKALFKAFVGAVTFGTILNLTINLLMPKLIAMAAGTLITGEENGNEAGNAVTSGAGVYNAQASQARGLAVLKKDDAVKYQKFSNEVARRDDAVEREGLSPFDPMSTKTFMGKIVNNLLPYAYSMRRGNIPMSILGMITNSFSSSLINKQELAKAEGFSAKELDICPDIDYKESNLAADPFCNLRYGIRPELLNQNDPEYVLKYMTGNDHIDEMSGEPKSTEYKQYIEQCINRDNAIGAESGEGTEEEKEGKNCIQESGNGGNATKYDMFRLFYVDKSINDDMDDDDKSVSSNSADILAEYYSLDDIVATSKKDYGYEDNIDTTNNIDNFSQFQYYPGKMDLIMKETYNPTLKRSYDHISPFGNRKEYVSYNYPYNSGGL